MTKEYNLKNALNFVNKLEKETSIEKVDIVNLGISLKLFAEENNEDNFKKIVNKYVNLLENSSSENSIDKRSRENPYSFLEFICTEIGTTRSLFQKLYGSFKLQ